MAHRNIRGNAMLISVPHKSLPLLFKYKGIERAILFIYANPGFSAKQLREEVKLGRKTSRSILKKLLWTEHIEKRGRRYFPTEKITAESMIVNLRDVRIDSLFRWSGVRSVLLALDQGKVKISELSALQGIPYRTIKRTLHYLRRAGIVSNLHINRNVMVQPKDPLDLVPRREYRELLRDYISIIEEKGLGNLPIILFGDASYGIPALNVELLVLIKGYMTPEEQERIMEGFVLASKNITSTYGIAVEAIFALEEVWLAHKLDFAYIRNETLIRSLKGICLRGRAPEKEDYFELHQRANPVPPTKIKEWIVKGYVREVNGRYIYAEKAIQRFREKAPTNVVEALVPILDRKIRFITVGKPRTK